MSKKIAAGAQAIVLDVKIGKGAFIKHKSDAEVLSKMMVSIAELAGREAVGLMSDMNQPLGYAVGNTLELQEAIDTLHGNGPADFVEHCMVVAGYMLFLGNIADDEKTGREKAEKTVRDGSAWQCFRELVTAQGGDVDFVDHPDKLPKANLIESITSPRFGYLSEIDALKIGKTAVLLGAGRSKKGDLIDHSVGIVVHNKVGNWVESGDPIFTIHANDHSMFQEAKDRLLDAFSWSDEPVDPLPLFYGVVR
jgi:pyrimidine-nucleoside phosphorylase